MRWPIRGCGARSCADCGRLRVMVIQPGGAPSLPPPGGTLRPKVFRSNELGVEEEDFGGGLAVVDAKEGAGDGEIESAGACAAGV